MVGFHRSPLDAKPCHSFCVPCYRYEQPKCDGNARANPTKPKDHYRSRHLQGMAPCSALMLKSIHNCCHKPRAVIRTCLLTSPALLPGEILDKELRIARFCPLTGHCGQRQIGAGINLQLTRGMEDGTMIAQRNSWKERWR